MIKLIAVGKIKKDYLKVATIDYTTRINKYHKINIIEIEDSNIKCEKDKIMNYISDKEYVIILDISGKQIDSLEFSRVIDNLFATGKSNITFVIGGSDGLDEEIKMRANSAISFSKMTFPHQLFRVIFLEQLYRAFKILNNETYHK